MANLYFQIRRVTEKTGELITKPYYNRPEGLNLFVDDYGNNVMDGRYHPFHVPFGDYIMDNGNHYSHQTLKELNKYTPVACKMGEDGLYTY